MSTRVFVAFLSLMLLGGLGLESLVVAQAKQAETQTGQTETSHSTIGDTTDQVDSSNEPTLRTFDPTPALVVAKTELKRAKFQVIDIHSHFGLRLKGDLLALEKYIMVMDANNIVVSVSMDSPLGRESEHLKFIRRYKNRLASFVHLDFIGDGQRDDPKTWASSQPGFVRNCVEHLKVAKTKGVLGLKFFKSFGLTDKNADGSLLKIDDPRWDPIWKTCGELGLPVIMHVADPVAFFQPIDERNERWEELSRHPDWSFYGDAFPSREELLESRNRVIKRHPKTNFIGAHFANNSEDLIQVAKWLDEYPNLVVEFASRINELGRQPYTARKFFIKYQDRILFGTDGPWPELRLSYYWRFLETYDEYFPYSEKSPAPQGMWRIYGIGLPDDVLKKIYHENAMRIVPGLRETFERATGLRDYRK
ncbi:MAG: amidohydrolase family protein [Mariniblastus sp.]